MWEVIHVYLVKIAVYISCLNAVSLIIVLFHTCTIAYAGLAHHPVSDLKAAV